MADAVQSQNSSGRKPTQAELLARFNYEPLSGALIRKDYGVGRSFRRGGKVAGHQRADGYIHVQIGHTSYYAHCLIWCLVTGAWPPHQIDHENLVRSDNGWSNLRLATPSQNKANIRARNKIGAKGVEIFPNGKFRARIRVHGRDFHLGMFENVAAAKEAYGLAAVEHFGEFARLE